MKDMVGSLDQTPDEATAAVAEWLEKYSGIMREINRQLLVGLLQSGKGLMLAHLQTLVEHRDPFGVPALYTSQNHARKIMGKNMFGVRDANKHFGVEPTDQQVRALSRVPFSEAMLKQCKDTHVLVAVFPLSILDIRGKTEDRGLFRGLGWYEILPFAVERGVIVVWQLIRKAPVARSITKTWQEQCDLLSKSEDVPTARTMLYAIAGHYLATGERLFECVFVRTSSVCPPDSSIVFVGFGVDGIEIQSAPGDRRFGDLGVASAWKP